MIYFQPAIWSDNINVHPPSQLPVGTIRYFPTRIPGITRPLSIPFPLRQVGIILVIYEGDLTLSEGNLLHGYIISAMVDVMSTIRLQLPKRSLIIPVAVPGSGKSTLLGQVLPHSGFRHGPDDIRRAMYGSVEEQGNGQKVHEAARAALECRLAVGLPAAYDATNVTPSARKLITDLGRKYSYHNLAMISNVSPEVAHARNQLRVTGRVPDHVIDRMAKQAQSAPVTLKEDFDSLTWFEEGTDTLIIDWLEVDGLDN